MTKSVERLGVPGTYTWVTGVHRSLQGERDKYRLIDFPFVEGYISEIGPLNPNPDSA